MRLYRPCPRKSEGPSQRATNSKYARTTASRPGASPAPCSPPAPLGVSPLAVARGHLPPLTTHCTGKALVCGPQDPALPAPQPRTRALPYAKIRCWLSLKRPVCGVFSVRGRQRQPTTHGKCLSRTRRTGPAPTPSPDVGGNELLPRCTSQDGSGPPLLRPCLGGAGLSHGHRGSLPADDQRPTGPWPGDTRQARLMVSQPLSSLEQELPSRLLNNSI